MLLDRPVEDGDQRGAPEPPGRCRASSSFRLRLLERASGVAIDHFPPERDRRHVRAHLAYLPRPGESVEQRRPPPRRRPGRRYLPHDEELGHVVDAQLAGEPAAPFVQREAGELAVLTNEEGVTRRIDEVALEMIASVAARRADLEAADLAGRRRSTRPGSAERLCRRRSRGRAPSRVSTTQAREAARRRGAHAPSSILRIPSSSSDSAFSVMTRPCGLNAGSSPKSPSWSLSIV